MKLVKPATGITFYETFSDLIFGTLVLFIVMVLALALKLQATADEVSVTAEELVSETRFTGGAEISYFNVTHFPIKDETQVVWLPQNMVAAWSASVRNPNYDPLLDLCRRYLEDEELSIFTLNKFLNLKGGINYALCKDVKNFYSPGLVIYLIRTLEQQYPKAFPTWSAEELKQKIGDIDYNSGGLIENLMHESLKYAGEEYQKWAKKYGNRHSRLTESKFQLLPLLKMTEGAPPNLRFSCTNDNKIKLGSCLITPKTLLNILQTIKPGKGFFVEYVSDSGEMESPPDWVMDEILSKVGFDGRIINEAELKKLEDVDK